MKRGMSKKGISPVIATVLLIALVLVLATIIFLWARSFFSEQIEKFGSPVEEICDQIDFDAVIYTDNPDAPMLEISNRGNIPIYQVGIKQKGGGNSKMRSYNVTVDAGMASRTQIDALDSNTETLIIYPEILGNVRGKSSNKVHTCLDNYIVRNI